jgi:hypothetical protein
MEKRIAPAMKVLAFSGYSLWSLGKPERNL